MQEVEKQEALKNLDYYVKVFEVARIVLAVSFLFTMLSGLTWKFFPLGKFFWVSVALFTFCLLCIISFIFCMYLLGKIQKIAKGTITIVFWQWILFLIINGTISKEIAKLIRVFRRFGEGKIHEQFKLKNGMGEEDIL